jgi:hypothetical protein
MDVFFDGYKMRELPPQVLLAELEKTLRFEENEAKRAGGGYCSREIF